MGGWGRPPPGTTGIERGFAASLNHRARSSRCARAEILHPRAMASATSGGRPQRQATERDRRRSCAPLESDRSGAEESERPAAAARSGTATATPESGATAATGRRREKRGGAGNGGRGQRAAAQGAPHGSSHGRGTTNQPRRRTAGRQGDGRGHEALNGGAGKERSRSAASDAAPGAARSDKREGSGCD